MTLLREDEQQRVAEAIRRVERGTDAELVTVLARQADDYAYIPLLWAGIVALVVPGIVNAFAGWWGASSLVLVQWSTFIVLSLAGRVPAVTTRLIPQGVRHWRASNLARRQFLDNNLHRTADQTGMLIFVSEAERYVEIIVDHGISRRISDETWKEIVRTFTAQVRAGRTLQGFIDCIDACGTHLERHVPATHERNELPDRLVVLS